MCVWRWRGGSSGVHRLPEPLCAAQNGAVMAITTALSQCKQHNLGTIEEHKLHTRMLAFGSSAAPPESAVDEAFQRKRPDERR